MLSSLLQLLLVEAPVVRSLHLLTQLCVLLIGGFPLFSEYDRTKEGVVVDFFVDASILFGVVGK